MLVSVAKAGLATDNLLLILNRAGFLLVNIEKQTPASEIAHASGDGEVGGLCLGGKLGLGGVH